MSNSTKAAIDLMEQTSSLPHYAGFHVHQNTEIFLNLPRFFYHIEIYLVFL
jgi:hypothetical protein